MKIRFHITILSAFLASAPAFGMEAKIPQAQDQLVALSNLAIRATSPDPSFGNKGERIGWLTEGSEVSVISSKQVSTVYGFEIWLEVQGGGQKGWVYDGLITEVLQGNAKLREAAAHCKLGTCSEIAVLAKRN